MSMCTYIITYRLDIYKGQVDLYLLELRKSKISNNRLRQKCMKPTKFNKNILIFAFVKPGEGVLRRL